MELHTHFLIKREISTHHSSDTLCIVKDTLGEIQIRSSKQVLSVGYTKQAIAQFLGGYLDI